MSIQPSRAADLAFLEILHMRDVLGMKTTDIARKTGATKNSVIGKLHRAKQEKGVCLCTKAANKDGGMPERWWA